MDFSYAFATPHRITVGRPDSSDRTLLDLQAGSLRMAWTYENLTRYPLAAFVTPANAYVPLIICPMLWLSPTNDFLAHIDNMTWNWRNLPDDRVRFSISPHLNHRHTDECALTQHLWFEEGGAGLSHASDSLYNGRRSAIVLATSYGGTP